MDDSNIFEVTNLTDLKNIISSRISVALGLTIESSDPLKKIMIRKFLKKKSKKFPLLTFIYMIVPEKDRNLINLFEGSDEDYPKMYYIRDGNKILLEAKSVDYVSIYESFKAIEPFYISEMKQFQKELIEQSSKSKNSSNDEKIENDDNNIVVKNNEHTMDTNVITNVVSNPVLEKKRNIEKLVLVNDKYEQMKLELIREIQHRKKIENMNNSNKKSTVTDDKEYRSKRRKK